VRVALAIALVAVLTVPALASEAWQWAERLETEKEQCQMLLQVCRQATQALEAAALTPSSADVLATRNAAKADLHVQDAVSAARVFLRKNGGRRLPCFDHPDCKFLDAELGTRDARPR
jgi:hypothetical protein